MRRRPFASSGEPAASSASRRPCSPIASCGLFAPCRCRRVRRERVGPVCQWRELGRPSPGTYTQRGGGGLTTRTAVGSGLSGSVRGAKLNAPDRHHVHTAPAALFFRYGAHAGPEHRAPLRFASYDFRPRFRVSICPTAARSALAALLTTTSMARTRRRSL